MHLKTSGNTQKNKWLYANKTFLIMKLIVFFVFVCCFQVNATNGQQVTLNTKNTSLRHIFNEIERQTGYHFFYKDKLLTAQKTSVSVQNVSVTEALYESMDHLPLTFSIIDKTIIIKESDGKPTPEPIRTAVTTPLFEEIKGVVTDGDGNPLQGVSIVVRGTTRGTSTGADGAFIINANRGDWLEFSMVGYTPKGLQIGASTRLNVELERVAATGLDEVVVTALGISREKKSLGYSAQEIKGDDVNVVNTGNVTDALSGKIAGVQIKRSSNLGGSTNIIVRGFKSLTGDNQALWVVDGVPIDNSNWNTTDQKAGSYGYDYGNMAADIDQDDIESINVLKGAAATALYGSRAANGAVIITTKSGHNQTRTLVSLNSGVSVGYIDRSTFPRYQKEYGGGYGPIYGPQRNQYFNEVDVNGDGVMDLVPPNPAFGSYGAPFDPTLMIYDWYSLDPGSPNYLKSTAWVYAKNDPITFYVKPVINTNNVAVEGSGKLASYRFSYTNYNERGLMPNSHHSKDNWSMKTSFKLNERMKLTGEANYVQSGMIGRNVTGTVGGIGNNMTGTFRQYWQTNADINELKEIYFLTKRNVSNFVGGTIDNPYWYRYEVYAKDHRDRFFGNISYNLDISDWLKFEGRVSLDNYSFLAEEIRNNGSRKGGYYSRKNINFQEINYDLMLQFNKALTAKLNISGVVGTNIRRNRLESVFSETNGGLVVDGLYSISNSLSQTPAAQEDLIKIGVNGVYGLLSFGYDNLVYLDLTGRNDQSSTLPTNHNSYFYPSISTSFIFSNLLHSSVLSFGKFRINYARVGNSAPAHSVIDVLVKPVAFGNVQMFGTSPTKNNSNLKPESTESFEVGVEAQFFKRRLGLDISLYKTNTIDQIMPVSISPATGYVSKFVNAGNVQNKGVELSLTGVVLRKQNLSWDVVVNWSKNANKVVSLFDEVQSLLLGNRITATVGQPYGTIIGRDFIYLNGERVINQTTGAYERTAATNIVIGNINPDWIGGVRNTFKYKNWGFGFLVDAQHGGDIFSTDMSIGMRSGLYPETVGLNDLGNPMRNTLADGGGIILNGIDNKGNKNTVRTDMSTYNHALGSLLAPDALFIYDASYIKLREMSVFYVFPVKSFLKGRIKSLKLTLSGSNVWIIHKNLPYADPEAGYSSGNIQGVSQGTLPTVRQFGGTINIQF